jgi:PAS domain S-box-containing protein
LLLSGFSEESLVLSGKDTFMINWFWNILKKFFRIHNFLIILSALFFMIPVRSFSMTGYNDLSLISYYPGELVEKSSSFLIFIIPATLIIICSVLIYFLLKFLRVNKDLQEINMHILKSKDDLQMSNDELAKQIELITSANIESDTFYGKLIQSADDGICFHDMDGRLKYANPAFYLIIGLDINAYNSVKNEDLIHPEDRDYPSKKRQALLDRGYFEGELRLRHTDGHYVILSTRTVTVRNDNGEIIGSLTISRDITRLKQVHEELIKANIDSEASNRLKSSFLANISHEIRTPLNSVVGFSNLLLSDDTTKEVREEYIEHINYNSEKLLQIIGDIIDLSRLESSQIEITYEETSLSSIVNEIIEDARQVIKRNEKCIILSVKNQFEDNGDFVFTDRIWLKRVLNHLMDNAVKFTLDGSIEFSYLRDNGNIVFKIKDTGIGINKENLGRIFEEFRQEVDGHHRPFEGLGIGLTLAKEVVERMGGNIFVQSEKGVGSEFSFSIPYRPAGSTKVKAAELAGNRLIKPLDWSSKKCLLVDDNKDVLIYLNRILVETGIFIITARSGFEAIELIKSTPDIDIILLDMQMPEMNGIEATTEIRKLMKSVPIIAQTAFVFEDDKDIILEAGCDACLIKPIRKDLLLSVLSGFIKSN